MSFYIKENDTTPSIRATLKNGNDVAVDLTNATVRFHMRKFGKTSALVDAAAVIINAEAGVVQYNWIGSDTTATGSFQAEFEVTYPDSTIETFPNSDFIRITITDDIT